MLWFLRWFPQFRALQSSLALAQEAATNASQQLIAERALRQTAEERADRYHEELVEALKENANWMAYGYSRRAIFGGVAHEEPPKTEGKLEQMPGKRSARVVASENDRTVLDQFEELKKCIERGEIPEEPQVGPEFRTA